MESIQEFIRMNRDGKLILCNDEKAFVKIQAYLIDKMIPDEDGKYIINLRVDSNTSMDVIMDHLAKWNNTSVVLINASLGDFYKFNSKLDCLINLNNILYVCTAREFNIHSCIPMLKVLCFEDFSTELPSLSEKIGLICAYLWLQNPHWNWLYEYMKEFENPFKRINILVIEGTVGVGKSTKCKEVVHILKKYFPEIYVDMCVEPDFCWTDILRYRFLNNIPDSDYRHPVNVKIAKMGVDLMMSTIELHKDLDKPVALIMERSPIGIQVIWGSVSESDLINWLELHTNPTFSIKYYLLLKCHYPDREIMPCEAWLIEKARYLGGCFDILTFLHLIDNSQTMSSSRSDNLDPSVTERILAIALLYNGLLQEN
jgi:hypothetical protein